MHLRYERGITNELDVTLADRELADARAQLAPLRAQVSAGQYTLATLIGRFPEDLVAELTPVSMIPGTLELTPAGLPVQLLRQRPDIQQAERELAASSARIGVATAALFPDVAVTAGIGFQRQGLGTDPAIGQHIWSAGPSILWPLLDFGTLDAQVDIADLQTRALLVRYRKTIQAAVSEVDTALAGYAAQQSRLAQLGVAVTASQRAITLAQERYERGLTDYLNVVDAERQGYDIQTEYILAQAAADEQIVALYRSLGGGWQRYQQLPDIRAPQPAIIAAFRRLVHPGQGRRAQLKNNKSGSAQFPLPDAPQFVSAWWGKGVTEHRKSLRCSSNDTEVSHSRNLDVIRIKHSCGAETYGEEGTDS